MTKRSNKKKRRYGQRPVVKKMTTDEPSLSMVSSTTSHSNPLLVLDDELNTKENNQSDMNSLDNSPSSTTSSKRLSMSPSTIPPHITPVQRLRTSLEACEDAPTPSNACDSTTDNCFVTSTSDVRDSSVLKKALTKKRKGSVVSSSVESTSHGELTYEGAYQVIEMDKEDRGASRALKDNESQKKAMAVKHDITEASASTNTERQLASRALKDNESRKKAMAVNITEASASTSGERQLEVNATNGDKRFPDSFEDLILMHFKQELDVAEMIESMGCLERDNEEAETRLSELVSEIDLLKSVTEQLDDASFK